MKPSEPLPPSVLAEQLTTAPPPARDRPGQRAARRRWGGLLVIDLALLLCVLSFAHVTAEGPAKRSLGRSVAILTEVDAFLDLRFEALQQEAAQLDVAAEIELSDFPLPVSFAPAEILEADRQELRTLLLTRAADQVYEGGMSLFREDRGGGVSIVSPQGAVRRGMDFLRPGPHNVLTALTWTLAALAAVLTLGLTRACRGYGRLVALGASVSLVAVPFLLLAIVTRLAFRLAADGLDEYLAHEFLELGQELTWAPIRNGVIFSVGGLLFLAFGATLAVWSDRRQAL